MAEELVVKDALSDRMIDEGSQLIRRLDAAKVKVTAAFWTYLSDANRWRLMIAMPMVRLQGTKKAYLTIDQFIPAAGDLQLDDITVVEDKHRSVLALRKGLHRGEDISGTRLVRTTLGGQYFEDLYIYRMT